MTDRELMHEVLEALESLHRTGDTQVFDMCAAPVLIPALRERLAQPEQCQYPDCKCATENPCLKGLAQPEKEFTTHEEGKDGWSDWVCPDPQSYLMKCCDCGLVHEAQFGVVRYTDTAEKENCDMVDDPNLQAVFRMRRSEQWTPKDTAYRPGGLAQPEQEPVSGVVLDAHGLGALVKNGSEDWHCKNRNARRLYTTPPQRKPEQELVIDCPRCGHCCPQSNILAAWMIQRSYATGHGDTIEDLLKELEWQVAEREREACAKLCETKHFSSPVREFGAKDCAAAIRARGNT